MSFFSQPLKNICFFLFLGCLFPQVLFSQTTDQETTYVQILSDIPLAPNLSLEENSEVIFDKAEGKIIEALAFGPADLEDTQKFYKESLDALGWKALPGKEGSYQRDEERLEISFKDGENDLQVRFRLMASSQ